MTRLIDNLALIALALALVALVVAVAVELVDNGLAL